MFLAHRELLQLDVVCSAPPDRNRRLAARELRRGFEGENESHSDLLQVSPRVAVLHHETDSTGMLALGAREVMHEVSGVGPVGAETPYELHS